MPIEPLNRLHNHTDFDCGKPPLNTYLQKLALWHTKQGLGRTFVLVHEGSDIIQGYYTHAPGSISWDVVPARVPKLEIPVMILARFAVHRTCQRSGIGKRMLRHFFKGADEFAQAYPCFAVSLDAQDDDAKVWYQQFGFEELLDNPRHLYLPMGTISELNL